MMPFPDKSRPDGLMGILVDLDMAIKTSDIRTSGAPHRPGTLEFMATSALHSGVHTFSHDLECVFLWLCVNYHIFPEKESKAKLLSGKRSSTSGIALLSNVLNGPGHFAGHYSPVR